MIITPRYSFTRPADTTAYADGDLISNTTTGANFEPLRFNTSKLLGTGCRIEGVKIYKSSTTTTAADFILNLFTRDPSLSIADNAALSFTDYRYFIGAVDLDMTSGGLAGSASLFERVALGTSLICDPISDNSSSTAIYGVLEADAAYTPASGELFEITLEISDK